MKKMKGQVAMEFLMTYWWAIMVVLVAVGALAYFGVFVPPYRFMPDDYYTNETLLLLKGGTEKQTCTGAPFLKSDYVDNYYNAKGVVDECRMPPNAEMDFIFKQHDKKIRTHSGKIKIVVNSVNTESHGVLQVLVSNDT